MRSLRALVVAALLTGLLAPVSALASKKYQVTGLIVELGDKVIVVEKKDGEKWEIDRTADTKIEGTLKKGAKVTIYYTMSASEIDVKEK
jgi:hypothetical protein